MPYRIKSFAEIGTCLSNTGIVSSIRNGLSRKDPVELDKIKQSEEGILRTLLRLKKSGANVDNQIAIHGATAFVCRMEVDDQNNPQSRMKEAESRIDALLHKFVRVYNLPKNAINNLRIILTAPTYGRSFHPWIEKCGKSYTSRAMSVRQEYRRKVCSLFRFMRIHANGIYQDIVEWWERLQRAHMISEKHELEEQEDLKLVNEVFDTICPHHMAHNTMEKIAKCPNVLRLLSLHQKV